MNVMACIHSARDGDIVCSLSLSQQDLAGVNLHTLMDEEFWQDPLHVSSLNP